MGAVSVKMLLSLLLRTFPLLLLTTLQVLGQGVGDVTENTQLEFPIEICESYGNCKKVATSVTLDSNWRWLHDDSMTNCYTGNLWDDVKCPDAATCTENCFIEGVSKSDWQSPYGIESDGNGGMTLKFVTVGPYSTNIGSRVFLLDESGDNYYPFNLKNKEFTMDVDVSQLPCGLNGAVYFVEMDMDGGASYSTNDAGAPYGTGYCDAQCPHDMKWITGEANCEDWEPSDNDVNSGKGHYGSCCFELDLWEANVAGNAFTNHPCDEKIVGAYRCEGTECGDNASDERYDGVCDKDGCDWAAFRLGDEEFYGPGKTIDTNSRITVVTQWITTDGTANGDLKAVRRKWIQNGKVIENTHIMWDGIEIEPYDEINDDFCKATKEVYGDKNHHDEVGGLKKMGDQMKNGMVLAMSLWDDHEANVLWLDSDYPVGCDPSIPTDHGCHRGPCPVDSGVPDEVEEQYPDASVTYGNLRVGDIDTTYLDRLY